MKSIQAFIYFFLICGRMTCLGQTKSNEIIIPLDLSSQRPIVDVSLGNKGTYKFIFDTGSSGNIIDQDLANELNLKVVGEDTIGTPGGYLNMMSKRVEASKVLFASTDLKFDIKFNTMPLKQMVSVDGIISPVVFEDYLVTIDYQASKLRLTKGYLDTNDSSTLPFTQEARLINLQINVDGNILDTHLDSGNPGLFALPYDLKDKLSFKQFPVEDGIIRTPGAEFKKWKAQIDGEIIIGKVVFQDPMVELVEGFSVVNMGYDFINRVITTIDRQNGLIQFEPSLNATYNTMNSEPEEAQNAVLEYVGSYGGIRNILIENGQLFIQRTGSPKLKLERIEKDYFKMTFPLPTANELPNIRFERNTDGTIHGLNFVFSDGREDFAKKDN